jgi:CMP-N,N'-diacetyllegionaminic acid synthase
VSIVAVVPARAGSKRVPDKNIRPCAGKPLLAWSAMAALAAQFIDRTILSTDDERLARVGRACGLDVPWLRPTECAADDSPMISVLLHALEWFDKMVTVEAVVLLQPTSPLRTADDIDGAVGLLRSSGADSVVTVMSVPNACKSAKLMLRDDSDVVTPITVPSAQAERVVVRNGPAVVVTRPEVLRSGRLYGPKTLCYEMPQERSIDIDTPFDFLMAELLLEYRQRLSAGGAC